MNLNLYIIKEDLADLGVEASLNSYYLDRTLRYPTLYEKNESLRPEVLYIVTSRQLDSVPFDNISDALRIRYSFLCVGMPNQQSLSSTCDIAWVPSSDISIESLLSRVSALFSYYNQWHLNLEKAIVRNKPLKQLGELSQEVFMCPIWLWDHLYQTLFHIVDRHRYQLAPDYVIHDDFTPWPLWEIDAWEQGIANGTIDEDLVRNTKTPYVLPTTNCFSYQSLCRNIFIGDRYVATLSVDDVGNGFTNRDETLLDFFASIVSSAIRRDLAVNTSLTFLMNDAVQTLLTNQPLSHSDLAAAVRSINWNIEDPYLCLTAVPINPLYTNGILAQTGEKVSKSTQGTIYAVADSALVFVTNLRVADCTAREKATELAGLLTKHTCRARLCVSTIFRNLGDLYFFYRQGIKVLEWGLENTMDTNDTVPYFYDSVIGKSIVKNICDHAAPEIVCPMGLMSLIDYDKAHGQDLIPLLDEYLNNNMNVSETSRKLYIHRNTVINKIKQIRDIMQIDIDDADQRFVLMLALRVLKEYHSNHTVH